MSNLNEEPEKRSLQPAFAFGVIVAVIVALAIAGGAIWYVSKMVTAIMFNDMIPEMEAVGKALEDYKVDHGMYPLAVLPSQELPPSLTTPTAYLEKIPVDQLNDDLTDGYQSSYRYFGWGDHYVILSHGPDNDGDIDAAQVVHSLLLRDYLTSDTSLSPSHRDYLIGSLYAWQELGYNEENGRFSAGDIIVTKEGRQRGPVLNEK